MLLGRDCHGSLSRIHLTGVEVDRRFTRCEACGRLLAIRPATKDGAHFEATVPRHKEPKYAQRHSN